MIFFLKRTSISTPTDCCSLADVEDLRVGGTLRVFSTMCMGLFKLSSCGGGSAGNACRSSGQRGCKRTRRLRKVQGGEPLEVQVYTWNGGILSKSDRRVVA